MLGDIKRQFLRDFFQFMALPVDGKDDIYLEQHEAFQLRSNNVLDKRATRISERPPFHYLLNTIFHCSTTTLGTNDNYIRSS